MMAGSACRFLCLMTAALLFSGCVRRPAGVLSDEEMAAVVADMELAEGYLQTQTVMEDQNEYRKRLMDGILEDHGVSREDFDRTMDWYGHNLDAYYRMSNAVSKQIDRRARGFASAGKGKEKVTVDPQSDLWPYGRMAMISPKSGSDALTFSLPGQGVEKGGSVIWRMRLRSMADLDLLLGVEYEDGGSGYLSRTTGGQKRLEFSLQTDTARKVTRVFGHIVANDRRGLPLWLDSISLEARPLDTLLYYRMNSQRMIARPEARRKVRMDSLEVMPEAAPDLKPHAAAPVGKEALEKVSSMPAPAKERVPVRKASHD